MRGGSDEVGCGRFSELELVAQTRERSWYDGKYLREPTSHLLDLVVDEISLRERVPLAGDMVTS